MKRACVALENAIAPIFSLVTFRIIVAWFRGWSADAARKPVTLTMTSLTLGGVRQPDRKTQPPSNQRTRGEVSFMGGLGPMHGHRREKRKAVAGAPATGSKHRQRPRAFERDPGATPDQREHQDPAQQSAAPEHGIMEIGVERLPVALNQEARKPRVAAETARIVHHTQPDRRPMEEVLERAQHASLSPKLGVVFSRGNSLNPRL